MVGYEEWLLDHCKQGEPRRRSQEFCSVEDLLDHRLCYPRFRVRKVASCVTILAGTIYKTRSPQKLTPSNWPQMHDT